MTIKEIQSDIGRLPPKADHRPKPISVEQFLKEARERTLSPEPKQDKPSQLVDRRK